MPTTYFPFRWMVGAFQEILDSSSGNSARIKSITDLRVLSFAGSTQAKYSSAELKLGDFSFLLLVFFFISFLCDCLGVLPKKILKLSTTNKIDELKPTQNPHPRLTLFIGVRCVYLWADFRQTTARCPACAIRTSRVWTG